MIWKSFIDVVGVTQWAKYKCAVSTKMLFPSFIHSSASFLWLKLDTCHRCARCSTNHKASLQEKCFCLMHHSQMYMYTQRTLYFKKHENFLWTSIVIITVPVGKIQKYMTESPLGIEASSPPVIRSKHKRIRNNVSVPVLWISFKRTNSKTISRTILLYQNLCRKNWNGK